MVSYTLTTILFVVLASSVTIDGQNSDDGQYTATIAPKEKSLKLLVGSFENITYNLNGKTDKDTLTFEFVSSTNDVIDPLPNIIVKHPYEGVIFQVRIKGINSGKTSLGLKTSDTNIDVSKAYVSISVFQSDVIVVVSDVIGWIYFVAWSVSFYPQIYENWRRKSVVGLNFDFLSLNLIGFVMYTLYNAGIYFITSIQNDYMNRHHTLVIPVKINDLVFAVHAVFAVLVTITQCFLYERGSQRVSKFCKGLCVLIILFFIAILISSVAKAISWLDFLVYSSYIKLGITVIKYVPQAYMNFVRKSTQGWSIGNVALDFTGGMFSMLQMVFDSYNFNDWTSFFGDPTKFGLGLFSVAFDILFILQHYVCYRHNRDGYNANVIENEIIDDQQPNYGSTGGFANPALEEEN